jgi:hypothetical protein
MVRRWKWRIVTTGSVASASNTAVKFPVLVTIFPPGAHQFRRGSRRWTPILTNFRQIRTPRARFGAQMPVTQTISSIRSGLCRVVFVIQASWIFTYLTDHEK